MPLPSRFHRAWHGGRARAQWALPGYRDRTWNPAPVEPVQHRWRYYGMRPLLALCLTIAIGLLLATPAVASCAPAAPMSERAARAAAVVYGAVTATDAASLTLRIDRSLKGQLAGSVRIFVGPGRGGASGTAVATSVDYRVAVGSDQVLYVIRGDDGALETNACIGSHSGPPDAEEIAFFGAATSVGPAGPSGGILAGETSQPSVVSALLAGGLVAALMTGTLATVLLKRRADRRRRA